MEYRTHTTSPEYHQMVLSTASFFGKFNTEQALIEIARMGLHHAEVFLSGYYEYTDAYFALLRSIMVENDIACTSIHSLSTQFEPQLFSIHPRQYDSAEELFRRILKGGQELGAQHYVMHGPVRVSVGSCIHADYAGPRARQLGEIAREYGITLTLENVHWCLVANPQTVEDLNPYVDGDVLGYTFDIKQAVQSGYAPTAYLDAMEGFRLRNVHICGALVSSDGGVKTGLPNADGPEILAVAKKFQEMRYSGPIVLEVYSRDYQELSELSRCVEALNRLFYGQ